MTAAAEGRAELHAWRDAIRRAVDERDPSLLALHLTRGRIPIPLRDVVYKLIIRAPWRDARPGRRRGVNQVDKSGIISLYIGTAIAGNNGRRQSREQIIDMLCNRFNVSKRTVERVLESYGGALPKPTGVLTPKRRT